MSLRKSESDGKMKKYTIISRWMHKTLNEWRIELEENGAYVFIYEEYIDFTTNKEHFEKFMNILAQYCPNLNHARLVFSGDKNDVPEDGIVECVLRLPNLQCLSLIDPLSVTFCELKNDFNQLTTLNFDGADKKITINCLADILGSMEKLHSLVYHYKDRQDQFVGALSNLTKLKALTLLYPPPSELTELKNCHQLEILHLYNINEKLSSDDFLEIFKTKRNLHTLAINFLEENWHLTQELHKLDAYCPQLIYLTINRNLDNYGDFVHLKYLKLDMDVKYLLNTEMNKFLELLCPKYADRLQILDMSTSPQHAHTNEISKLKSLKALLCWSWSSNMYKCLSELSDLQLFSLETFADDSIDIDAIKHLIENCSKLNYLRLPLKTDKHNELILTLPDVLHKRGFQPDKPFVLSLVGLKPELEIEEKLKTLPHGNLLQLDWNSKTFAFELKNLIASLRNSKDDNADKTIYQNPCKMPGDRLERQDEWVSNMNYRIALKSCSNKFNLEYDEMLINRCRNMVISNADYELSNMQFAFNFKYDAIEKHYE